MSENLSTSTTYKEQEHKHSPTYLYIVLYVHTYLNCNDGIGWLTFAAWSSLDPVIAILEILLICPCTTLCSPIAFFCTHTHRAEMIKNVYYKKMKSEIQILTRCIKQIWLVGHHCPLALMKVSWDFIFLLFCHKFGKPKFIQQK